MGLGQLSPRRFLSKLEYMNISSASIRGTVPLELLKLIELLYMMDFREHKLMGSFRDFCGEAENGSAQAGLNRPDRAAFIDCDELECSCCECSPMVAPSLSRYHRFRRQHRNHQ
jgi:hypothetical protein